MTIKQIYSLVNDITSEALGEQALEVAEDLSNIVDVGDTIANKIGYDKYVGAVVNKIAKVVFVDRAYRGGAPSVLMDNWEFGSIVEKIQCDLPVASQNDDWALSNGQTYDPYVVTLPTISEKFYNQKVTFEIDLTITELQVKQSFRNAVELNKFISMIYNAVEKSMTIKIDELVMRTIDNMIGETIYDAFSGGAITGAGNSRAVNLLKLYNDKYGAALTAAEACQTPAFVRFAVYTMNLYKERLAKISTLFNVGGKARFTPSDVLHTILLSDFESGVKAYLQSDSFHKELVALENYDVVPYWQGSGTDYAFTSTAKIDVKTAGGHTQAVTGILGVMFDREALGVTQADRRTTSIYNPKAEYYNNFFKFDANYFNDFNENFVVFYVA